jgi:hypothetical protein
MTIRILTKKQKQARAEYIRKWNRENKERARENKKRWKREHKDIVRESNRKYDKNHREQVNQRSKRWRDRHPERHRESVKKSSTIHMDRILRYRELHKKEKNEYTAKYDMEHREERYSNGRKRRERLRRKLMSILGDTKCWKCGYSDFRVLVFDHINGGGRKEKIKYKNSENMYKYYLKHPEEAKSKLQILCSNCNIIKVYENKECCRLDNKINVLEDI